MGGVKNSLIMKLPKQLIESEADLHKAVCEYIKAQYPKVLFNTDMSGIKLTPGLARKASALRSNKGFPDIMILEPKDGLYGLFIELKREGEKIATKKGIPATPHIKEQWDCIKKLRSKGYSAHFCCGFDQAKQAIDDYFSDKSF
jgi:hypothetical protein